MASFRFFIITLLLSGWIAIGFSQNLTDSDSLHRYLRQHTTRDAIRVDMLNQIGSYFFLSDPEKTLEYAYQAFSLAQEINYTKGEAQALRQMGLVSYERGNYAFALKQLINGLNLAEISNDSQIVADISGNIGLVYRGLGDYQGALQYHKKSLILQRKLRNSIREAVALNNMGDAFRALKNYQRAIEFYQLSLKISKQERDGNIQATNIRNIGNVLELRGDYHEAKAHYFESMLFVDSLQDKRGMIQCRLSIASAYFRMQQHGQAKHYAHESLAIAQQNNFKAFIRDAYLLLSQISEAQHHIRESFLFFKLYSNFKDSVVNLQIASDVTSHRIEYETHKKEAEIDLLKKDALLQKNAIAKQNTVLLFIVIILLLVAIIATILFRNYSRQKTVNRLLEIKNKEIAQQHLEIEQQRDEVMALNYEIHTKQLEVVISRDELAEKNASIAEMNKKILLINENLEKIIHERTSALEKQNQQLIEYAFINAHKLRAPLARIMGLANLLNFTPQDDEQQKISSLLQQAAIELDQVTRSITLVVQEGLDAYQQ